MARHDTIFVAPVVGCSTGLGCSAWGWVSSHVIASVLSVHTQAVFEACAQERCAVADLLADLDGDQLAQSSLCSGWDIRTVAAHLASVVSPSKKPFVAAVLRHRGDIHRGRLDVRVPVPGLAGRRRTPACDGGGAGLGTRGGTRAEPAGSPTARRHRLRHPLDR
ncbi:MAG: hypothetical protein DLM62_00025 [Pseudonocardiales bacterium]|nr:MAG: hypothetical protein DLM62_00025 [Pseudonocardiales bacterium]